MDATVRLCSVLQMFLYSQPGLDDAGRQRLQLGLTEELFPAMVGDSVRTRLLSEPQTLVFHEEQLLYLAYLAIGWSADTAAAELKPATQAELLLRINDLVAPNSAAALPEALVSGALHQAAAMAQEQPMAAIGRRYEILFGKSAAAVPSPIDFRAAFQAQSGVPLEKYLWLVSSYNAFFVNLHSPADLRRVEFDRVIGRINALLGADEAGHTACERFTGRADWYRRSFGTLTSPEDPRTLSYVPFHERPFIELRSGAILPVAPTLGLLRMSFGLYWTLFTHYQGLGDEQLNAFTSSVGQRFQDYVSRVVTASVPEASGSRVVLESHLAGAGRSKPAPDLTVASGSAWAIFEVTTSAITMQTAVRGDVSAFRKEVREKFAHKLAQPLRGFGSLVTRALTHPALNPDAVTDVYPVLVTLDPFPLPPGMERSLHEDFVQPIGVPEAGGRDLAIHTVSVLSAEEVELLYPILQSGVSLTDLLRRREVDDPRHLVSMKNYLLYAHHDAVRANRWVEELLAAVRDATQRGAPLTSEE